MTLLIDIGIIILCILALWYGAIWIVGSATRIARRTGLSELIIGLTVVALGTSAPEFAVTLVSAFNGQSDISVGNIVGSNIFNLGFILGGVALVSVVKTTRPLIHRDGAALLVSSLILLFFLRDLTLSRLEGGIFVALLIGYVLYLISQGQDMGDEIPEGEFSPLDVGRLIAGLALIVGGGHFLVESASEIARFAGISEWVIGVTIVAAGTSAPEMATSLTAVLRGQHGLSAGNLIGSDLFNVLGVLGVAGMIQPLQVDAEAIESVLMLSGMILLVLLMLRSRWELSRWEGGLLVLIGVARWLFDFLG
ncbi:MAG: sodium:calcium antiporter [Chloroflexota bacterium]